DNSDRGEQRLPRVDWSSGEGCDYAGHYAERGQQDNVDFGMAKEPPDVVPEVRASGCGGEEGGSEKPVGLEHYEARDSRGEGPEKLEHGPEGEHCEHWQLDEADTCRSVPEDCDEYVHSSDRIRCGQDDEGRG